MSCRRGSGQSPGCRFLLAPRSFYRPLQPHNSGSRRSRSSSCRLRTRRIARCDGAAHPEYFPEVRPGAVERGREQARCSEHDRVGLPQPARGRRPLRRHVFASGHRQQAARHEPARYADFTPLNILAREYVVFAVKADSPIASLKDLTARLKKETSQSVSFAFATARGNHNHIVLSMYLKSIGIDPRTAKAVIYPGGGPAQTAMLGGHIDVYVASPRSMVPVQNEGRARILAISSPERQTGAQAALPTFRELGHDAVFFTWRGFMGPKGLKAPKSRADGTKSSPRSLKATTGAGTPNSRCGTPTTC